MELSLNKTRGIGNVNPKDMAEFAKNMRAEMNQVGLSGLTYLSNF
jgi:hypothetical protein